MTDFPRVLCSLQVHLETNLVKRKEELQAEMESVNLAEKQAQLRLFQGELLALAQTLQEMTTRFQVFFFPTHNALFRVARNNS